MAFDTAPGVRLDSCPPPGKEGVMPERLISGDNHSLENVVKLYNLR